MQNDTAWRQHSTCAFITVIIFMRVTYDNYYVLRELFQGMGLTLSISINKKKKKVKNGNNFNSQKKKNEKLPSLWLAVIIYSKANFTVAIRRMIISNFYFTFIYSSFVLVFWNLIRSYYFFRECQPPKKPENVNFTYTHMQLNNTWQNPLLVKVAET